MKIQLKINGRIIEKELAKINYKEISEEAKIKKRDKVTVLSVMGKTKRHKYIRQGYKFKLDGEKTAQVFKKVGRPLNPKEIVYTAVDLIEKEVKIGKPILSSGRLARPNQVNDFQNDVIMDMKDEHVKVRPIKEGIIAEVEKEMENFDSKILKVEGKRLSLEEVDDILFGDVE